MCLGGYTSLLKKGSPVHITHRSGDRQGAASDLVLGCSLSAVSLSRYKKLEDLLEKSFSLVKMPSLQPVVMCVMKHLPKVTAAGPACPGGVS